jgi:F-type H+-transporting ATPase subunit epsilon
MEPTFSLEIITPYRVFVREDAEMIIVKTVDGELGILPDHEPVAAPIAIGPIKIKADGEWKSAAVSDGFLEVERDRVTMLVGAAEWPEEIDLGRAERSRERALERIRDTTFTWEGHRAQAALQRAETRLKIAKGSTPGTPI